MTASATAEKSVSAGADTPSRPRRRPQYEKLNKQQKEILYLKSRKKIKALVGSRNYAKIVYPLDRAIIILNALGLGGDGEQGLISGIAKTISELGDSNLLPKLLRYQRGARNSRQSRFVVPARKLADYNLTVSTRKALYDILNARRRIDTINHNRLLPIVEYLNNFSADENLRYTTWLSYLGKSAPFILQAIDSFRWEYAPADGGRIIEHPKTKRVAQVSLRDSLPEELRNAQFQVGNGDNGWRALPPPIFQTYSSHDSCRGNRMMAVMDTDRLANMLHTKVLEAALASGGIKELPGTTVKYAGHNLAIYIEHLGSPNYLGCLAKLRACIPGVALRG